MEGPPVCQPTLSVQRLELCSARFPRPTRGESDVPCEGGFLMVAGGADEAVLSWTGRQDLVQRAEGSLEGGRPGGPGPGQGPPAGEAPSLWQEHSPHR